MERPLGDIALREEVSEYEDYHDLIHLLLPEMLKMKEFSYVWTKLINRFQIEKSMFLVVSNLRYQIL